MIQYTTGNLLDAKAEALVNTVNTVGVMGKGIALMFKEAFPENFKAYAAACKDKEVVTSKMFITGGPQIAGGPKWIINFPTKQHWRAKTKLEWIDAGLDDLVQTICELAITSIALPPLGCGNGGQDWSVVKQLIEAKLGPLQDVDILVFEPTEQYQNVAKREGVKALTPARALVAELVRRYSILGIQCSLLEVQKLAWFLDRAIERSGLNDVLKLEFTPHIYGPYADQLRFLLNELDGSYLKSEVRIPDAKPSDTVVFDDRKKDYVATYLKTESEDYLPALEAVSELIEGFESPLGLELLATVDWLLSKDGVSNDPAAVRAHLSSWNGDRGASERKLRIFTPHMIKAAVDRLATATQSQ